MRAAEEADRGDDDEHTEDRRVPEVPVLDAFGGEDGQCVHHGSYRLRSNSMIASICSLVRMLPKCAMRPDEMPRTP